MTDGYRVRTRRRIRDFASECVAGGKPMVTAGGCDLTAHAHSPTSGDRCMPAPPLMLAGGKTVVAGIQHSVAHRCGDQRLAGGRDRASTGLLPGLFHSKESF